MLPLLKKITGNTIVRLLLGIIAGLLLGQYLTTTSVQVILSLKHLLGQVIFFLIPLIVIGYVAASITQLAADSSRIFVFSLVLAYVASIAAESFALMLGYTLIPGLSVENSATALNPLPEMIFRLDIPPVFSVMTALFLAFLLGLGTLWTRSVTMEQLLSEFRNIVSLLIKKVLIPVIPVFVALNFAVLGYEGAVQTHLPVFGKLVLMVIVVHIVWLLFLYGLAVLISRKNPLPLWKAYIPAYLTAMGTMSSMATLGITMEAVKKSRVLDDKLSNFTIPFLASIHLCGSVITIVFFVMGISLIHYGALPETGTMLLFVILLAVFAVSAPGVPGGTVIASLGLITSVLGFDETGLALLLSVFALQDSFGTATNVVSDGALAMIIEKYGQRKNAGTLPDTDNGNV